MIEDLKRVDGIGPGRAQRLMAAEIDTVGQLALAEPEHVAEVLRVPVASAQMLVDRAGMILDADRAPETPEVDNAAEEEDLPPLPEIDDLPIPEPEAAPPVDVPMAVRESLLRKGGVLRHARVCRSCKVIKARPNPNIGKSRRPGDPFQHGLLPTHIPCDEKCVSRTDPEARGPGTFSMTSPDAGRGLLESICNQPRNLVIFAEFFRP